MEKRTFILHQSEECGEVQFVGYTQKECEKFGITPMVGEYFQFIEDESYYLITKVFDGRTAILLEAINAEVGVSNLLSCILSDVHVAYQVYFDNGGSVDTFVDGPPYSQP